MKNIFKDYFYFTLTERNGLMLLSFLILFLLGLPTIYSFFSSDQKTDFSDFKEELVVFEASLKHEHQTNKKEQPVFVSTSKKIINPNTAKKEDFLAFGITEKVVNRLINYRNKGGRFFKKEDLQKIYGLNESDYSRIKDFLRFPDDSKKTSSIEIEEPLTKPSKIQKLVFFNPNLADQDLLEQLGFSEKTIRILFNYRNKGGSFYKKEDLLKIYGMEKELYNQLEPYILLDQQKKDLPKDSFKIKTPKKEKPMPTIDKPKVIVDINQASEAEWQQIKGVGTYYSQRIIAFRNKLGGFSSINQIKDTYGMPDSVFQRIKPQLKHSPILTKISINQIDAKTLRKHPYLTKKQAIVITNYRANHGPFTSVEDLHKIKALTPEIIVKVGPYLSFE